MSMNMSLTIFYILALVGSVFSMNEPATTEASTIEYDREEYYPSTTEQEEYYPPSAEYEEDVEPPSRLFRTISNSDSDSDSDGLVIDPNNIGSLNIDRNRGFCVRVRSQNNRNVFLGLNRKLDNRCRTRWVFLDIGGSSKPGQQNFVLFTAGNRRNRLYLSTSPDRLSKLSQKQEEFSLQSAGQRRNMRFNIQSNYNNKEFNNWGLLCNDGGNGKEMLVYKNSNSRRDRDSRTCQWQFIY